MTTKPSAAPWADEPYTLLSTLKMSKDKTAHSANHSAREMALTHNCLLRILNSVVQQGPYVYDASQPERYKMDDVKDLLFYVKSWTEIVDHHHRIEEAVLFPGLQKLSGAPSERIANLETQHAGFHDGLISLQSYASTSLTSPNEYRWEKMKAIIDGFAPSLNQHLIEEVDVLFVMAETVDSDAMKKCFDATEKAAINDTTMELMYNGFPSIVCAGDKTFEGGNTWPPLPTVMLYAIKYWFARRHHGAWRFCPCDFDGKPVPLKMIPQSAS